MASPKQWDRKLTKDDEGHMYPGIVDKLHPGIYDRVDESLTLEDECEWMMSLFHNPDYSQRVVKDTFRPNIRTSTSVGTTNYMTQSRDVGNFQTEEAWTAFVDMLVRIIAHDKCNNDVLGVLAFKLVSSGVNQYLPDTATVARDVDDEFASYIDSMERMMVGSENGDAWTGNAKVRLQKKWLYEVIGCTKAIFGKSERVLSSICFEIFGSDVF